LSMSVEEVKNRITVTGAIEIGRAPGVVIITLRVPDKFLSNKCFAEIVRAKYS